MTFRNTLLREVKNNSMILPVGFYPEIAAASRLSKPKGAQHEENRFGDDTCRTSFHRRHFQCVRCRFISCIISGGRGAPPCGLIHMVLYGCLYDRCERARQAEQKRFSFRLFEEPIPHSGFPLILRRPTHSAPSLCSHRVQRPDRPASGNPRPEPNRGR